MENDKPLILLTNDDSINSPGLWAAAEALSEIAYVEVVAPRDQQTAMGRSLPHESNHRIEPQPLMVHGKEWTTWAIGGTPAQSVLIGLMRILKRKPDLVVSGINYGENIASGITVSGTVGAALEAASFNIPAMAVSRQVTAAHHFSLSGEIDFSVAAYFCAHFAKIMLKHKMPPDVDVLKVDIPYNATRETPWVITRQSRQRYYHPSFIPPEEGSNESRLHWDMFPEDEGPDSKTDLQAVIFDQKVAVCPVSLDLSSRVDWDDLRKLLIE